VAEGKSIHKTLGLIPNSQHTHTHTHTHSAGGGVMGGKERKERKIKGWTGGREASACDGSYPLSSSPNMEPLRRCTSEHVWENVTRDLTEEGKYTLYLGDFFPCAGGLD
jgi:hypothetical protein